MKQFLTFASFSALLAGCGVRGGGPVAGSGSVPPVMAASPSSLTLDTGGGYYPTPQPVTITSTRGFGALQFVNPNPPAIGISVASQSATSATLLLTQIAPFGSAPLVVRDGMGDSISIPLQSNLCPRPPYLDWSALVSPAPGARNVSAATPTLYLEIGVPSFLGFNGNGIPDARLHVVANGRQTIDPPSPLAAATLPPGAATPTPAPNTMSFTASAVSPALAAGSSYEIYVYQDACGGDETDAGGFST